MAGFDNSLAHLLAEMECTDLSIRALVARVRAQQTEDDQFRGLYLSEQHVDTLLGAPLGMPPWLLSDSGDAALAPRFAELRTQIDKRKQASVDAGVDLRLERLKRLFGLDEFDLRVVLICLAPAMDSRYEKLYAYLQDDVTKTRPSIDLVLCLIEADPLRRLAARAHFDPGSPLMRYRLLEVFDDPSRAMPPLIGKYLKADDRIVAFLLGSDQPAERIARYVERGEAGDELASLVLDDTMRRGLQGLAEHGDTASRIVVHLQGRPGIGRRAIAKALCRARGLPLVVADLVALLGDTDFMTCAVLIDREARLAGAALYWENVDVIMDGEHRALLAVFEPFVDAGPPLAFLAGETLRLPEGAPAGTRHVMVTLTLHTGSQRLELWRKALSGQPFSIAPADLTGIATRFRFTPRQIVESIQTADSLARWRDPATPQVKVQDVYDACRYHSNRTLSTLAHKITPRVGWDDIVLPADRLTQLREICNHMKYRHQVFGDWGFDRKLVSSKGLMALFAGPSGTGKTMAAEIIAGELGLDLYKIDLSSVISKFIGETEKNLGRIFDEAESANAVLFFDEADALFGRRSEVKDSHDRYANIEVGYLLQRIEEYEGVAILATNFRRNMDEAFVRRLQFTVDFALPDEADRFRMWQRVLPEQTPRDAALDLALLARRFDLSGGNIRNIALAAAFLAADGADIVRMTHLIAATQREYQKMGKLVADGEFGGMGGEWAVSR